MCILSLPLLQTRTSVPSFFCHKQVWIGSRVARGWNSADRGPKANITHSNRVGVGVGGNGYGPESKQHGARASFQNRSEVDSESTGTGGIVPWLPCIEIDRPAPPANVLPVPTARRRVTRGGPTRAHGPGGAGKAGGVDVGYMSSAARLAAKHSGLEIYMTSIDLALMRGHLSCAQLLGACEAWEPNSLFVCFFDCFCCV